VPSEPEQAGARARPGLDAYRVVLQQRGVAALTATGFLARIPSAAAPIALTLHVVLTLDRGYTGAGLVGAAATVGSAVGAPLLGRRIDRSGARPVLVLTALAQAGFWGAAPWLPFPPLLVGSLLAGALGPPVYAVVRQALVVAVPPARRRPAFALDAMAVETAYVVGPAIGALLALQVSTSAALWAVGGGWFVAGVALLLLDPATGARDRGRRAPPAGVRPGVRLLGALVAALAAVFVVLGSELAVIAALQTSGQADRLPLVHAAWAAASLVGAFAYGAARRAVGAPLLVAGLGIATLPVALGGAWWTYLLLLVPAGLLCAPSMAASTEAVLALAPREAGGLVAGLLGSAQTLGAAVGVPLSGLLIDTASPAVAVLAVAAAGTVLAAIAGLAQ
jgi:MFS family permease